MLKQRLSIHHEGHEEREGREINIEIRRLLVGSRPSYYYSSKIARAAQMIFGLKSIGIGYFPAKAQRRQGYGEK